MMNKLKILILDDEDEVLQLLSHHFIKNGHQVRSSNNPTEALEINWIFKPDALIVDLVMPEMDGIEFTQHIRQIKNNPTQPAILIFTERAEDYSIIAAHDAGADDYVIKPVRFRILEAKIQAIVARYRSNNMVKSEITPQNDTQNTVLFIDQNKVIIDGQEIILANKEYQLLYLLCSQPKKIFGRTEIYQKLWKKSENVSFRTIDVHIRKLRDKTKLDCIKTLKGVGYKIEL